MDDNQKNDSNENIEDDVFDYGKLINEFSDDDKSDKDDTDQSEQNVDDFVFSELAGGDGSEETKSGDFTDAQDTSGEDIDDIFKDLDDEARESVIDDSSEEERSSEPEREEAVEAVPEISIDETGVIIDDSIDEESSDYASLLGQFEGAEDSETTAESVEDLTAISIDEPVDTDLMGAESFEETQAGIETENIQVTSEHTTPEVTEDIEETGKDITLDDEELLTETLDETEFSESDFSESDFTESLEETPVEEQEEVAVSVEKEGGDEDDFLGLGGISGGGAPGDSSEGYTGGTTEVLFEGVEMDFDEQVKNITLAEVLLAQGKKQEATELFNSVASQKGVTHWVEKRLRALKAQGIGNETKAES